MPIAQPGFGPQPQIGGFRYDQFGNPIGAAEPSAGNPDAGQGQGTPPPAAQPPFMGSPVSTQPMGAPMGIGGEPPTSPLPTGETPGAGPAMAGLQAAAPDVGSSDFSKTPPGTLNPNLGKRNYPNEISGLKSLTY